MFSTLAKCGHIVSMEAAQQPHLSTSANKYISPSVERCCRCRFYDSIFTDRGEQQHHMCSNRKSSINDMIPFSTAWNASEFLDIVVFQFSPKLNYKHSMFFFFRDISRPTEHVVGYQSLCCLHVVYFTSRDGHGCLVAGLWAIKQPSHRLLKSPAAR